MELKQIIFIVILITSVSIFLRNILRLLSYVKLAQPENRSDHPWKRIIHTLKVAIGQSRIFRFKLAGIIHAGIFWGFLMLLFSAAEAVIQGIYPKFSLSWFGPFYPVITISTEIFCLIVFVSILISLIRRFIIKVERLPNDSKEIKDALIVLLSIFFIVTALLLYNSTMNFMYPSHEWMHPVSVFIIRILPDSWVNSVYHISWWVHIVLILAFANYLPFSKHFHVYTSIPNVYFSNYEPTNKVDRIDFEKEGIEKFGVVDFEDLSWKSVLDSYSCTHCGRCTSVCPAHITGKELSPREIIVQIRHRTLDKAPIMKKQMKSADGKAELTEKENELLNKKFVGDYESVEALWQCTTCGACMQECPITIEHVPAIIGMRRSLVMMESNFPPELQSAFSNLENNGSPWAFSASQRTDWASGLDIKTCAENPEFDVLFWVGCAGSFDDRAIKISRAFSQLMKIAGINFSILGNEEKCNGDPARRTGNEYLADMLVKSNIETLNNYKVKKIVTTCPHCFNTFKNEYPDFGAKYEVIHHTEFLLDLIKQNKFKFKNGNEVKKIGYHDSCYLGRYNNIYDKPREIIESIKGFKIQEAHRHHSKGLCCGAGGGQMFMEETKGKRVNIERTEELVSLGTDTVAANCPFCLTMLTDGVKTLNLEDKVHVQDVSEILLENIEK
ncbi:MAG: 4Fe-4S dicluster domain-containing protein [Ignavibacteriae bacterium]|nr:4Fe-4S dicluster domain-containing protein [Ignavibacteriota bacterium]